MSSKRAIRRRSCEGKRKYDSIEDARAVAKKIKRRGDLVEPYRCAFCGGIHIGHASLTRRPGESRQVVDRRKATW